MFHILIVEDEDGERDGISYLIREYGLELSVAEARNGRQALEYMENHPVDILFTDIKMPFIGGLELAAKARELYGDIKVIIFSAYGEFDYAREAVKLDAFYYLLKPIVVDEFVEVMNNVIRICEEENEKKRHEKQLQESYQKMRAYGQKKLLFDLISGARPAQGFYVQRKLLELEFDVSHVYMTGISFRQRFFDTLNDSLEVLLEKLVDRRYAYLNLDEYQSVLFIERSQGQPREADIIGFGQRLMEEIDRKYGIPACVVVSRPADSPEEIFREYLRMEQQMEYRFFFDESMLLFSWNEEAKLGVGEDVIQKITENIGRNLEAEDYYSVEQGIQLLFGTLKNRYNSTILCKYTCAEIVKRILKKAGDTDAACFDRMLEKLFRTNSLDALQEAVTETLETLKRTRAGRPVCKSIGVVLDYIHTYYGQDISLESIGKAVYLSPGYLSAFFKKETGQSLTKYITSYRLEKAKELLTDTNKKVVDISREVGFSDNFGLSPAKFRERNLSI